MKKLALSVLTVGLCIGGAFAQSSSTPYTGNYAIQVQDFITLTPSGAQGTIQILTFSTPSQMSAGLPLNPVAFNVVASRSWKASHTSTNFNRMGAAPPVGSGISLTAPAAILKIWVNGLTGNAVNIITNSSPGVNSTNAPQNIASAPLGSLGAGFTLNGAITPGFALNLSGTYTNTVTIVASLD